MSVMSTVGSRGNAGY